ncbi:MAG TPA: hypothetical protein VHR47_07690 [Bacillota bacterium]|nr:hypothetical protein [Bacillota bacterium]
MKRISLWLLVALLMGTAGIGLATDTGRIVDGINEKSVSLDIDGERLVWADQVQQMIGIYNFTDGKTENIPLKVIPRSVRVTKGMIFFLAGETKTGDPALYPFYCNSKKSKVYRLDTTFAEGLEAEAGYIVWYNRDRVVVQNLWNGTRQTLKADQAIRDAAVSQDTLVYIDGQDAQKDYLYTINLRTGAKKSYAFMNIGDLAMSYPLVALTSADENTGTNGGKAVYIVNLETEQVTMIDHTYYPALLRSDSRYGLDMARGAVAFRSTLDPSKTTAMNAQGIYLYDLEKNKLMNVSPIGVQPALSNERVAWVENGGIYVYKYR